jgi:hypothetical protein
VQENEMFGVSNTASSCDTTFMLCTVECPEMNNLFLHTHTHLSTSCLSEDKQEVQRVHQDGMVKINSKGANTIMYRSINIAVIS